MLRSVEMRALWSIRGVMLRDQIRSSVIREDLNILGRDLRDLEENIQDTNVHQKHSQANHQNDGTKVGPLHPKRIRRINISTQGYVFTEE